MIHFWLFALGVGVLGVLGLALVNAACSVVVHAVMDGDRDPRQYVQALGTLLVGVVLAAPGVSIVYVLCFRSYCGG